MVSKARREHLKRARSLAQQRREELRIEALVQGRDGGTKEFWGGTPDGTVRARCQARCHWRATGTVPPSLVQGHEDALLEIVGNDQGEEGDEREEEVEEQTDQTFYWDSSATETDTESEPDVESELNNEIESLPTNEQSRSASGTFGQLPLRWNQDAGKNLRGAYGSGSRSTHKRERRIESVSVPHSLGEFHAHNFAHAINPPLHGASWWPCTSTYLQKRRTTSGFRRSETSPKACE
ncbi:hypothetical protein V8E54_013368 [Elaphomyces granulatus]